MRKSEQTILIRFLVVVVFVPMACAAWGYWYMQNILVAVIFLSMIPIAFLGWAINSIITPKREREIYKNLTEEEHKIFHNLVREYACIINNKSDIFIFVGIMFILPMLIAAIVLANFFNAIIILAVCGGIVAGAISFHSKKMKEKRSKLRSFLYSTQYAKSQHIETPK